MGNMNGGIAAKLEQLTPEQVMERFDSLPPEVREILRDAPYDLNLSLEPMTPEAFAAALPKMRNHMVMMRRQSCYATYGADHPDSGQLQWVCTAWGWRQAFV